MENTHREKVSKVLSLGITSIRDARYTSKGNVVVYTSTEPNKSIKTSVINTLRPESYVSRITWKSARAGHTVYAVTKLNK